MSFVKNDAQQMTFDDALWGLTEREKKMLDRSWATQFADHIFPLIDEEKFSVLYSDKASRPNTPVNVTVGALILKELRNQTDDEIFESILFDVRYQTALHTTSFKEQPMSDTTLKRFRNRCLTYETEHGVDLIRECVNELSSEMAKLMNISFYNFSASHTQIFPEQHRIHSLCFHMKADQLGYILLPWGQWPLSVHILLSPALHSYLSLPDVLVRFG